MVHLTGRLLLPLALRMGISANALSCAGLGFGAAAAWSFYRWTDWRFASAGFLFCVAWLIADGMDGMVARARGTTSDFGRFLDGVCDHLVFLLLYLSLALSIGTVQAWILAVAAGSAHAVQATLYEGERGRYHRRIRGDAGNPRPRGRNLLVQGYEAVANSLDRAAAPFDRCLEASPDRDRLADSYGRRAAPAFKMMALLSNNMRVVAIYLACLAGNPLIFWWLELVPLSGVAIIGIWWHRRLESQLVRQYEVEGSSGLI
ncbi:MAG: CDP-alcohol phosphatidyltransferase family protein [Allosphingosinicella sp.]